MSAAVDSPEWAALVRDGAAERGVDLTPEQVRQFSRHAGLLLQWNRRVNLTRITDPEEMAIKHFVDAVVPVRFLPSRGRLLDIGSGGGFPGVPLKVIAPSLSITLIDAVRKKVSFLQHLIRTLALDGMEARHTRAEELSAVPAYGNAFDGVICRALSSLDSFVGMALPLVRPGGTLMAMKGKWSETDAEMNRFQKSQIQATAALTVTVEQYRLPVLESERSLVIFRVPA